MSFPAGIGTTRAWQLGFYHPQEQGTPIGGSSRESLEHVIVIMGICSKNRSGAFAIEITSLLAQSPIALYERLRNIERKRLPKQLFKTGVARQARAQAKPPQRINRQRLQSRWIDAQAADGSPRAREQVQFHVPREIRGS